MKSCTVLAVQADGAEITTVEGLGGTASSTPPGSLLGQARAAVRLLHAGDDDDRLRAAGGTGIRAKTEIGEAISGNLCRCTGYLNIVKSIQSAAERLRQQ